MVAGSCLCGAVRWQVNGPVEEMTHCHCSMCRKSHGASFGTYVDAKPEDFEWLSGGDKIAIHISSTSEAKRAFCETCGSQVPAKFDGDVVSIPAGGVDGDPGIRAAAHIFASSAAPWDVIGNKIPSYDGYIVQEGRPNIDNPETGQPTDGIVHGSCLCGKIAYEVTEPFKVAYNCHCSRCQKARAAAFATNGFVSVSGVRFTRGEDLLSSYKVPDAQFFTQVFGTCCGSPMPRRDEGRGVAVIPFGSLDDDPQIRPVSHIFVGSKACWYEIEDDLPTCEEGAS